MKRTLDVVLIKTRNMGDQVLLRYQADALNKYLSELSSKSIQFRLRVITSFPDVFHGRPYQVITVNRGEGWISGLSLFRTLIYSARYGIFVFYSTNRNRVILGLVAKFVRFLWLGQTWILSFKSDFLENNTYSDLSLEKARGRFQNALFRDHALTVAVEKLISLIAEKSSPKSTRHEILSMQKQIDDKIEALSLTHFESYKTLDLNFVKRTSGYVLLSLGASQEPRMIDLEMVQFLLEELTFRLGKKVILHKAPTLTPHETRLFNLLTSSEMFHGLVAQGFVKQFTNSTIAEFEEVARNAELFIGTDSGPKHLAISQGVSSLSLDYSGSLKDWHFYDLKHHMVLRTKVPCRPGYSDQPGYEWCGINYCDHLSCHKLNKDFLRLQLVSFFEKKEFDVTQALVDFPELKSFYQADLKEDH